MYIAWRSALLHLSGCDKGRHLCQTQQAGNLHVHDHSNQRDRHSGAIAWIVADTFAPRKAPAALQRAGESGAAVLLLLLLLIVWLVGVRVSIYRGPACMYRVHAGHKCSWRRCYEDDP